MLKLEHKYKNELKIEIPKLFISNYFIALKSEIDLFFVKKQGTLNDQEKEDSNRIWKEMIDRIDAFQTECFKTADKHLILDSTKQQTELVNSKAVSDNNEELVDLINEEELRIQKILFSNKSTFFLIKKEWSDKEKAQLVIINDECLSKEEIKYLKTKYYSLFFVVLILKF